MPLYLVNGDAFAVDWFSLLFCVNAHKQSIGPPLPSLSDIRQTSLYHFHLLPKFIFAKTHHTTPWQWARNHQIGGVTLISIRGKAGTQPLVHPSWSCVVAGCFMLGAHKKKKKGPITPSHVSHLSSSLLGFMKQIERHQLYVPHKFWHWMGKGAKEVQESLS